MIFINFSLVLYADEKQSIINRLVNIDNITFDFEQITNEKKEVGKCILVFDNKLNCDYEDSAQKRILTNGKTLIIQQKRYDKIYFYPIKNSPFVKILNKGSLINLIKESDYQLKNNIELTYFDRNKKKIIIFFETDSINIKYVNSEINPKIFKIPSID
jgi:outer membrane lipoprotein-sorting protein